MFYKISIQYLFQSPHIIINNKHINRNMVFLRGWRYAAFISCFVGGIGLSLYPIIVEPMMNVEKYKELQKHNRIGIEQEEIQPGNMKVWSDPFGRK